jgi:hypothetical protein
VEDYYSDSSPFVMLLAGLLISATSGLAFQETLKQSLKEWSRSRSSRILATLRGFTLVLPYLGMSAGICVFLASGLQIFSFPLFMAYAIAAPLTLISALLVWYQLGRLLTQLEQGGSKALDLDSLG